MTDDKKSIPDAGRVDESLKPGKVESVKAGPPPVCRVSTSPAEVETTRGEDVSRVATSPAAGRPIRRVRRSPRIRMLLFRPRIMRRSQTTQKVGYDSQYGRSSPHRKEHAFYRRSEWRTF